MTMPNFLIIGAAKSGTTALYQYLKQHPQIYMSSVKEPEFFAFEGENLNFNGPGDVPRLSITNIEDYQAQFQGASNSKAIGEASPLYLYSPKAPHRIKHYVSEARLIVILRDPVERAYSQFLMFVRDGRETTDNFTMALLEENTRVHNNWAWGWHYTRVGFYYSQLKRYFDQFNPEQIKVYLYEDLCDNPLGVLQDIFCFLEVDEKFIPNISLKHNISGIPSNKSLHTFLTKSNFLRTTLKSLVPNLLHRQIKTILINQIVNRNLLKPDLDMEVRNQLIDVFQEDIIQLQNLIHRDLSAWLNKF